MIERKSIERYKEKQTELRTWQTTQFDKNTDRQNDMTDKQSKQNNRNKN